nr:hypothetical protein [Tanacetum cinerariifolium]
MPPKRRKGEELEYLFFEGDGSSFDEQGDYGLAGDDYKIPPVFVDDQFEDELEMGDDAFVLIGKGWFRIAKFPRLCFLYVRNILMPHYRLCLGEHEELRRQVEEFVSKGHIRFPYHGDSSDDDLLGNSRTNFVYP